VKLKVQPTVELALVDVAIQAGGADAAAQLVLVVFVSDDQHFGPPEDMLIDEVAAIER